MSNNCPLVTSKHSSSRFDVQNIGLPLPIPCHHSNIRQPAAHMSPFSWLCVPPSSFVFFFNSSSSSSSSSSRLQNTRGICCSFVGSTGGLSQPSCHRLNYRHEVGLNLCLFSRMQAERGEVVCCCWRTHCRKKCIEMTRRR
jgi:hypothetical protein